MSTRKVKLWKSFLGGDKTAVALTKEEKVIREIAEEFKAMKSPAMIVKTSNITKSTNGNKFFIADLYYDDGAPANYQTADRLISFLQSGGTCLLYHTDGTRVGLITSAFATETSSGYSLMVYGITTANYYGQDIGFLNGSI